MSCFSMSKIMKWLFIALALFIIMAGGLWYWYQRTYPYGMSHCCDKILMFALHNYAEDHDGAYPAGESSPEASLSLLYPHYIDHMSIDILRGKTIPLEVVQPILERGGRLGPDTCGWHYVEGLRLDDDRRLALFWDKIGLGHNGERLSDGGHRVFFVGFGDEYIPGSKWNEFLAEQKQLHEAKRKKEEKPAQNDQEPIRKPS